MEEQRCIIIYSISSRLTATDYDILSALAKARSINLSQLVRAIIQKELNHVHVTNIAR